MRIAFILVCALACALPGALGAQGADDSARRITEKPEYRGYRVERRPDTRPSDWDPGDADSGSQDGGGSGESGADSRPPRRGTAPAEAKGGGPGGSSGGPGLPGWVGPVFEAIAWIVVIAVAAVAVFFIVKALLGIRFKGRKKGRKKKKKKKAEKEDEEETESTEEPEIEIDEQVFEDALAVARREYEEAIKAGDYAGATLLGYRIFWLKAGWQGCVQQSDKRTWRDALRMVRQREARARVRELLPLVERVRYADYVPDRSEFNEWRKRIELVDPTGVLK